ncbi:MAG: hypothetical protein JWR25_2468 [Noviherbaspirillum sp.]|nr:hypothetical protein [Noviherbaspirillum sp.]
MATPSSSADNSQSKSRLLHWAVVLITTVVLHLLVMTWASGHIGLPAFRNADNVTITTELLAAAPPGPPPPAAVRPAPSIPRAKQKAAPVRKPVPPMPAPQPESAPTLPVGMEVPGTSTEPVIETAQAPDHEDARKTPPAKKPEATTPETAVIEKAENERKDLTYKIAPPPSADLKYDVHARRQGQKFHGSGRIVWHAQGPYYLITGEANLLVFSLLNFKSDGLIDEFGVSPELYSEKRFRRAETNTHFHRERSTISFSASTVSYPRKGGEQDRASIIWQLAAIGRGDASRFASGAEIDIFVAGVRDGETWNIKVVGEEEIEVGIGRVLAWHVVRQPRLGSYDQKIDIWLAPQQNWYPIKILYTENNGDFLDMSLSNFHLLPMP